MPYSVGYAIADIASLKALSFDDLVSGYARWVISKSSWYGWDANSTASPDNDTVVVLDDNPQASGRFVRNIAVPNITGGVSALLRQSVTHTTSQLASQATEFVNLPLGKAFHVLRIATNNPAWVRIYAKLAYQSADSVRAENVEAPSGSGIIAEAKTALSKLVCDFTDPMATGGNLENTPTSNIAVSITNRTANPAIITTTFTIIKIEN